MNTREFCKKLVGQITHAEWDALDRCDPSLTINNHNREALLEMVWKYDYMGDMRTVDVHIRRLREKIEENPSEPKYVHTKWGVGYYFNA